MTDTNQEKTPTSGSSPNSDAAPTVTLGVSMTAATAASVLNIHESALPVSFGRFELRAVLGRGGFATVYRAYDRQLEREVAVKIPRQGALDTADQINRFFREARSGGKLNHPNICPIHDVGQFGVNHFIVMGLVDGTPLSRLAGPGKPLDVKTAVQIVLKLTAALAEAHAVGIVHRDLKPSNVIIDEKRREPVILDFGLARSYVCESTDTQSGQVVGTPSYMSPEQARGLNSGIGPASDIYSLGVILYELLVGYPPFRGSTAEVFTQILTAEPEPPSRVRSQIDAVIAAICLKAIAKNIRARFASMGDFGEALQTYLQGPQSAAAPHTAGVSAPTPRTLLPGKPDVLAAAAPPLPHITIEADKIEFACPRCQLPVRTAIATAGKKGMCPNCGVVVQIPAVPQQPATAVSRTTTKPARPRKAGAAVPAKRIEFRCSHCGNMVATPASGAGKRGKCPSCGSVIDIPAAGQR